MQFAVRPAIPALYEREEGFTHRHLCHKCMNSLNKVRNKLFWDINHWAVYCTCGTYNKITD